MVYVCKKINLGIRFVDIQMTDIITSNSKNLSNNVNNSAKLPLKLHYNLIA